jgi:hypothetical protein
MHLNWTILVINLLCYGSCNCHINWLKYSGVGFPGSLHMFSFNNQWNTLITHIRNTSIAFCSCLFTQDLQGNTIAISRHTCVYLVHTSPKLQVKTGYQRSFRHVPRLLSHQFAEITIILIMSMLISSIVVLYICCF